MDISQLKPVNQGDPTDSDSPRKLQHYQPLLQAKFWRVCTHPCTCLLIMLVLITVLFLMLAVSYVAGE